MTKVLLFDELTSQRLDKRELGGHGPHGISGNKYFQYFLSIPDIKIEHFKDFLGFLPPENMNLF